MPSVAMARPVLNRTFSNDILTAIRVAAVDAVAMVAPKIALIGETGIVITPDTTKAELDAVQAVFTGYTAGGAAVTFNVANLRHGQNAVALAGNVSWVVTAADPQLLDTVTGWYLYDTTFGLICSENLAAPVVLGQVGDWFDLFAGVPLYLGN